MEGANSRQHVANTLLNNSVGEFVELRRLGVDDDDACARCFRSGNYASDRIDLQRAANREQQVSFAAQPCMRALDDFRDQRLAERDRRRS